MNELDKQLQNLAANNWKDFSDKIGTDAIVTAKIHLLKETGLSYKEIAGILNIKYRRVVWACIKN